MARTSLQERILIQTYTEERLSDRQIVERMHLGLSTVRKWRRRSKAGMKGLESRMGRPACGAMSSFEKEIEQTLRAWREAHPGWGPKTLLTELMMKPVRGSRKLPSISTITRWLKQAKLSRAYGKHSALPAVCVSPTQACHEEWEMDARGHEKISEAGVIALININDVFSKTKVMSFPCWLGDQRASRHPTKEDYQLVLRMAFTEWGLPDRLAVDHDSVYHDNCTKSPFPTRFHLWLLALGITLTFGRMGQPKDQAMTERSHQIWQHQVLDGQSFTSKDDLWQVLKERRYFMNWNLPCATLGNQPPLIAHPEACQPRRQYRIERELELIDMTRVYAYLAQGCWYRKASNTGAVSLGSTWYTLGRNWSHLEVVVTFDPQAQQMVFQTPSMSEKRSPLKKLTAKDLTGDLDRLTSMDAYQLALPFSSDDWRMIYTCSLAKGVMT